MFFVSYWFGLFCFLFFFLKLQGPPIRAKDWVLLALKNNRLGMVCIVWNNIDELLENFIKKRYNAFAGSTVLIDTFL